MSTEYEWNEIDVVLVEQFLDQLARDILIFIQFFIKNVTTTIHVMSFVFGKQI